MKFAYITNNRLPSEKANAFQIAQMCAALAAQGADLTLFYPARHNTQFAYQDLFDYYQLPRNFKLHPVPCIDLFPFSAGAATVEKPIFLIQTFTFAVALLFILARQQFDAYYARDIFVLGIVLGAFRKLKKKMFFEAHTSPNSKWGKWWHKQVVKRIGGVVSIGNALGDQFLQFGISPHHVLVAPDAVDLKRYAGLTKEKARAHLKIKDQRLVVYTGHLYEWKGAGVLAEAAAQLDNVEVWLVGGTASDVAKMRARAYPNTKIIGHVSPEQIPFYQIAADVLVLPNSAKSEISRLHTSPLKLFEYMASGVPIVASNLPSLCEVLRDQHNALLVEPDNVNALANGINLLLSDRSLANSMATTARKEVEGYTWVARAVNVIRFCS